MEMYFNSPDAQMKEDFVDYSTTELNNMNK